MKLNVMAKLNQAGRTVAKHSPLLLTITGVIGLGATAVYSYKAAKKVEVIVDELEVKREVEERVNELSELSPLNMSESEMEELDELTTNFSPVNRLEVVRDISGAVALPVVLGFASIASITLSYYILNNRNNILAAALGTAMAEHAYYRKRVREEVGEDMDNHFNRPAKTVTRTIKNDAGKDEEVEADEQVYIRSLHGEWFDRSSEYTIDDHSYNLAFINAVNEKLQLRQFQRGYLLLNEVYDALGFDRTRSGALIGWTTSQSFQLETSVTKAWSEDGNYVEPQIYISWTKPQNIYDKLDYDEVIRGSI